MARYKADIQGSRGKTSRLGTASSGIWGHIRGWNIGVEVNIKPSTENQEVDEVEIFITKGSNEENSCVPLCTIKETKS